MGAARCGTVWHGGTLACQQHLERARGVELIAVGERGDVVGAELAVVREVEELVAEVDVFVAAHPPEDAQLVLVVQLDAEGDQGDEERDGQGDARRRLERPRVVAADAAVEVRRAQRLHLELAVLGEDGDEDEGL